MQFIISTLILSLAAFSTAASISPLARTSCAEASRFGDLVVVPSTIVPGGDSFTVHADFTCALSFGIVPEYIDYYVKVLSGGNGHIPPILLGRREFHQSFNTPPTDTFTAFLPDIDFTGAQCAVFLDTTFPLNATDGKPYYTVGGTEYSVTIANSS